MASLRSFSLMRNASATGGVSLSSRTIAATKTPRAKSVGITQKSHRNASTTICISLSLRAMSNIKASGENSIGTTYKSQRSICCVSPTNNEETSAKAAAADADSGSPTIFDKIIAKEIPSRVVFEDEKVLAFWDINPQAPVHILVIPKFRDGLTMLGKADARHGEILGHLLYAAKIVAEKEGILDGFRVVINNGPAACKL
ncbi:14 kDa zinc-binding protein isoform X2 [Malania oleifera]|uniref:14 kDa zinc-binding protein isoform X2 n=1 Tax=Malania oleifera TaxID=397392 RepID=UPI0025AE7107|nr:14 kDa zinc-binding protein isoform X2 [Malania oleifera]